MSRAERIKELLRAIHPTNMELLDDSHKHAGHAGASPSGETHYTLKIESGAFDGLTPVQRHQLVYKLLDSEFKNGLHALSIQAAAPKKMG